jgi:hypothetical protein
MVKQDQLSTQSNLRLQVQLRQGEVNYRAGDKRQRRNDDPSGGETAEKRYGEG